MTDNEVTELVRQTAKVLGEEGRWAVAQALEEVATFHEEGFIVMLNMGFDAMKKVWDKENGQ